MPLFLGLFVNSSWLLLGKRKKNTDNVVFDIHNLIHLISLTHAKSQHQKNFPVDKILFLFFFLCVFSVVISIPRVNLLNLFSDSGPPFQGGTHFVTIKMFSANISKNSKGIKKNNFLILFFCTYLFGIGYSLWIIICKSILDLSILKVSFSNYRDKLAVVDWEWTEIFWAPCFTVIK